MEAPKCKLCGERHYGLCSKGGDVHSTGLGTTSRPKREDEKPPVVSTKPAAGAKPTKYDGFYKRTGPEHRLDAEGYPKPKPVAVIKMVDEPEVLELHGPWFPEPKPKPKFDRNAYQRDLMRKRRAAKKADR